MNNRQLQYFLEVFHCRSMKKAAAKIIISPQGLSKTIQSLEAELGTALFERTPNGLIPTDAAITLKPHAEAVIAEYKLILEKTVADRAAQKLTFRIPSAYGELQYLTTGFLRDFYDRFSTLTLDLAEMADPNAVECLKSRQAELAILPAPLDTALFSGTPLFTHDLCVIIHKSHPLAKKRAICFQDLRNIPLACVGPGFHCFNHIINLFMQHGVRPTIFVETANHAVIRQIAEDNLAIGISLDFMTFGNPTRNTVIRPFANPKCVKSVYLAENANATLSADAHAVKEFFLTWIQNNRAKLFHWDKTVQ